MQNQNSTSTGQEQQGENNAKKVKIQYSELCILGISSEELTFLSMSAHRRQSLDP